jgi:hypothetical protein
MVGPSPEEFRMSEPKELQAFQDFGRAAGSAGQERVEPRHFLELLLSRKRLVRASTSHEGELALRDPQTGSLFVVGTENLKSTLAGW